MGKNILRILTLYFTTFFVLLTAFYLMMPFSFENYGLILFLNNICPFLYILISMFIIYKNIKHSPKTIKNCNIIYSICKRTPINIYILYITFSVLIFVIFRSQTSTAISLISIFSSCLFYIFTQKYFKNILNYSENNFRAKTNSIAEKNILIKDIPESINLLLEVIPLILSVLLIGIFLSPLNYASSLYLAFLVAFCIISLIYISLNFYNDISNIGNNYNIDYNYNNEFSNLAFKFNTNKQIYDNNIKNLENEKNLELEKERLASIEMIRRTVDAKDTYTRGHSDRVSAYSVLIGKKLSLSDKYLEILKIGGLFHDIGKIGIPDRILLKEGKLTDEEYNEIKKHPSIGAHILENSNLFKDVIDIVLYHHEKFDGTGYPQGLKGNYIPLMARIVSVADAFDAMTTKRTYKDSIPIDIVKEEFKKCSGAQFDPDITKAFLDILDNDFEKIKEIMNKY